jgi:uncharacterized protein YndB with AHSA1/START domain
MPTARRSRTLAADPEAIWRIVGDPSHLARWWPRVERIEGARRGAFTQVMRTKKGRSVRADFHVAESERARLLRWAQDVEGTPFERFLAFNETSVLLESAGDGATKVTLESRQKLKGLSRMGGGGFMLKRATRKSFDEALDALEALVAP